MRKHNVKLSRAAAVRAETRWNGSLKILSMMARAAAIVPGTRGAHRLSQVFGL